LDLIDHHWHGVALKKGLWLLFRPLGFCGEIQRDELVIGEKPSKGGGLASLASASQHDNGARASGPQEARLYVTGNPHMLNIQYDCIFCIYTFWVRGMIFPGMTVWGV
jgi:hypothetical protein